MAEVKRPLDEKMEGKVPAVEAKDLEKAETDENKTTDEEGSK